MGVAWPSTCTSQRRPQIGDAEALLFQSAEWPLAEALVHRVPLLCPLELEQMLPVPIILLPVQERDISYARGADDSLLP